MRQINDAGLNIVKYHEGLSLTEYLDIKGVLTIGYGHTGPDVTPGKTITSLEAIDLLKKDLATAEQAVERCVRQPLTDNQFSACVSLCFNIGQGAFMKSTLVRLLNEAKYKEAADQFLVWCHANGQTFTGLFSRRRAERDLFLKP